MKSIVQKHGENDFSIWFVEIPENDPLWEAIVEKYGDSGCSVRGTLDEIAVEIKETV